MRTTYVPPLTSETAKEIQKRVGGFPPEPASKSPRTDVLLVGLDLGTNSTRLKASFAGSAELAVDETVPTVVGYVKEGIVENFLPDNAKVLYGQLAMTNRAYLRLVYPLVDGVVSDLSAAQDFTRYLRQLVNPPATGELRAIIGLPANAERAARESLTQAVTGLFHKVILIPEPFLAALGYRDESKLTEAGYLDPIRNSLMVDIGAGTTDVCLVQGYFPTAEDQLSIGFAGDKVDGILQQSIRKAYPDIDLSLLKVREIKEQFSYVGKPEGPVAVSLVVGGKMRKLDLGEAIGNACEQLLQRVFDAVKTMIAQASIDMVTELMQNIILTGGGSRIRNIDSELQRLLVEDGFEKPRVLTMGDDYKEYVARGALVAARQAKETQWQQLSS
jgi:rod shape-determining protein MreB